MIPEFDIPGQVVHICFWPKDEERIADIVREIEENDWAIASENAYPELWIANCPYATLIDYHCSELILQLRVLAQAIRKEGGALKMEHDMFYRDENTGMEVTGVFTGPVKFWEPKDNL